MIISAKCPNCGATMNVDSSREVFFCSYCGTKMYNVKERIEVSGGVSIDTTNQIANMLRRAVDFEQRLEYDQAFEYYNKVLDIDSTNATARQGYDRLNALTVWPNCKIVFNSEFRADAQLKVKFRRQSYFIQNGRQLILALPPGNNTIAFRDIKSYTREVPITSKNEKVTILFTRTRRGIANIEIISGR